MVWVFQVLLASTISCSTFVAWPNDTEVTYSSEQILLGSFESIREFSDISTGEMDAKTALLVLGRITEMPKLEVLRLHNCDLSSIDEKSPIPENVKTVLITGGKLSPGVFRWLSKFPKRSELVFGGQDLQELTFDELKGYSDVTFDNCTLARPTVLKLLEHVPTVTFKEIVLVEQP